MPSLLALEGVYCGYGGGDVLQGLDLEVEEGSITCIVGPNGAGKSTVLRAVSGVLRPRKGRIFLDGDDITRARAAVQPHAAALHHDAVRRDGEADAHVLLDEQDGLPRLVHQADVVEHLLQHLRVEPE